MYCGGSGTLSEVSISIIWFMVLPCCIGLLYIIPSKFCFRLIKLLSYVSDENRLIIVIVKFNCPRNTSDVQFYPIRSFYLESLFHIILSSYTSILPYRSRYDLLP